MRCESCGQVLTPQSDPLCRSCMNELRAGPYLEHGEPERSPLNRVDSNRLNSASQEESAA
jgi:hypothetical protein